MRKLVFLTALVVLSCSLAFHEAEGRRGGRVVLLCGHRGSTNTNPLVNIYRDRKITKACRLTMMKTCFTMPGVTTPKDNQIPKTKTFFVGCIYNNLKKDEDVLFIDLVKMTKNGNLRMASININHAPSPIDYETSPDLRFYGEICHTGKSYLFAYWKSVPKNQAGMYRCTVGVLNKKGFSRKRSRLRCFLW